MKANFASPISLSISHNKNLVILMSKQALLLLLVTTDTAVSAVLYTGLYKLIIYLVMKILKERVHYKCDKANNYCK
jgi:hypothetical protein